jgi:hypothetical protein
MPAKLKSRQPDELKFKDIRDGQLVTITSADPVYLGDIGKPAQRVGINLIMIGEGEDEMFAELSEAGCESLRFRVLKDGEKITVVGNE